MKAVPLDRYKKIPGESVDNEYDTSPLSFKAPMVWCITAPRAGGKSWLCSKYLIQEQNQKVPTFDRVYMISPTSNSNASYFGNFVNPEDIHLPTRGAIDDVVSAVEGDRDEWVEYLEKKELYKQFQKDMHRKQALTDDEILRYMDAGFLDKMEKPEWKYPSERPPTSLLVMDDCLSTPALSTGSSLGGLACKNRHIGELPEVFVGPDGKKRSACGLSMVMLVQSYKSNLGSLPKAVRDNTTEVTLFSQKNEKVIEAVFDELGQVVPMEDLYTAYNYCTKDDPYGCLTISMRPKIPELKLRKGLDTALVFPEESQHVEMKK